MYVRKVGRKAEAALNSNKQQSREDQEQQAQQTSALKQLAKTANR